MSAQNLQYRACWISAIGETIRGIPTDKEDATEDVKFLKKYREAWLEDTNGQKVEIDEA